MFILCGLLFCLVVGSLHVGDEILEINGTNVTNHSVDQLQKAMVGIFYAVNMFASYGSTLVSLCIMFLSLYLVEGTLTTASLYSVQERTVLYFHLVNF